MKTVLMVWDDKVVHQKSEELLEEYPVALIPVCSINQALLFLVKTKLDLMIINLDGNLADLLPFLWLSYTSKPDLPILIVHNEEVSREPVLHIQWFRGDPWSDQFLSDRFLKEILLILCIKSIS